MIVRSLIGTVHAIILIGAFMALFLTNSASGQQIDEVLSCSTHFQARADWLSGLDGTEETVELMESYAEILWVSVPQDLGMSTGFSTPSHGYVPDTEAVLRLMTTWAETAQEVRHLPLCMEDAQCARCTEVLRDIAQ